MSSKVYMITFLLATTFVSQIIAQALTDVCLSCICKTVTGCDVKRKCDKSTCGPFKISWGYWADGGKPTIASDSPDDAEAYKNCATDPACAIKTVEGYMEKFAQDCNGDGDINCYDFLSIHVHGGYGCNANIPAHYLTKYAECAPADYVDDTAE